MKQDDHAPTPWNVSVDQKHPVLGATEIRDVRGRLIEWIGQSGRSDNEANAAHIVKCVNAHDELVAEMRRLLDHFETWARDHSTDATAETWAIIYCARAALTKAEA